MKKYIAGLMLGLLSIGAAAQTEPGAVVPDAVPAAEVKLPEGVITAQHPLKLAFLAKHPGLQAYFRPSDNMPEVVNEDLLRGELEPGKSPGKVSRFIGYMPKLKVLPCPKGCEGSDYEKAVAKFIKGYRSEEFGKGIQERGELIVQVRWFNARPFFQRSLPYGADSFGVSFLLEGKLVSLGMSSGVGIDTQAYTLAERMGARLGAELLFTLGLGAKPSYVTPEARVVDGSLTDQFTSFSAKAFSLLGKDDVRSRIEPATAEHAHLMPAIDGIQPGEIAPIDRGYYIGSLMGF